VQVTRTQEEKDDGDYFLEQIVSQCEGVVKEIEEGCYDYKSKFGERKVPCYFLTLDNTRIGQEKVEFPCALNIIERDALVGKKVKYKLVHTLFYELRRAEESWVYKLEIAKGKYKGFYFTGNVGFSPPLQGGP